MTAGGKFQVELVGDFARQRCLELVSLRAGEVVLDAGCGTGRLSRPCALARAQVVGCDRDEGMLQVAADLEKEAQLGIEYHLGHISRELPVDNGSVDAILCSAALMHDSPRDVARFFVQARKALRVDGKLVGSVLPHPQLLDMGLSGKSKWIQYDLAGASYERVLSGKEQFVEHYWNVRTGQEFFSHLFLHSPQFLKQTLELNGFSCVSETDKPLVITRSMLEQVGVRGDDPSVGYASHTFFVAYKLTE